MTNIEIFIDAEYLLQSLRSLTNKPYEVAIRKEAFQWHKLVELIAQGRNVSRITYYTARLDQNENKDTYDKQTVFLQQVKEDLAEYNIQLRLGKMIKIRNKTQKTWNAQRDKTKSTNVSWGQKGIDTKIILDMCRFAYEKNNADKNIAVLVSGDEDFAEVLSLLKEKQLATELVSFDRRDSRLSDALKATAENVTVLSYDDCITHKLLTL